MLQKGLFFATALALILFVGQASAQSVSLTHVPGEGGTMNMVSGQGTEVVVEVSQMGLTQNVNAVEIEFAFDMSLLTLAAPSPWLLTDGNKLSLLLVQGGAVPASFQVTFMTKMDATNMPFSIGINSFKLDDEAISMPSAMVNFNGSSGGMPTDGEPSVSLMSGGSHVVRGVGASEEVVVNLGVSGVMGETGGFEVVFMVEPAVAMLTGVDPSDATVMDGMGVARIWAPTSMMPSFGSVTFTTDADYDGETMFTIRVASFNVFKADGMKMPVPAGISLMVNNPDPMLMRGDGKTGAVMIPHGGEASVMVEASGFSGEVMFSSDPEGAVMEDGTVTATHPMDVTVMATDGIDPIMPSLMLSFIAQPYVSVMKGEDNVAGQTVKISHGDTAMLTAMVMDAADGAEISFHVETTGTAMSEEADGVVSVSATGMGSVTITAMVGDYTTEAVSVMFEAAGPEVVPEHTDVTIPHDDGQATVRVTTLGFPEGANITYKITSHPSITSVDEGGVLIVTALRPGMVTVTATDGMTTTDPVAIHFHPPPPALIASAMDAIIPMGGVAHVDIMAIGFGADVSVEYSIKKKSGTATITTAIIDNKTVQIAASGMGGAVVEVSATAGSIMPEPVEVTFWPLPTIQESEPSVMIPSRSVPSGEATVTAMGFPPSSEIRWEFEVVEGSEDDVRCEEDGNVLTLKATGPVVVKVQATDGMTTTEPVMVTFTKDMPAAPSSLTVEDYPGDNGHYVMVTFTNSEDHASVTQYRIYREIMVSDSEGAPEAMWVPWAVVDALPSEDNMTRAVIPVPDGMATRWGVASEVGYQSSEIMPAGKRVFSKESVQVLAQVLGMDPNLIVSEDELAKMFMPSAAYIQSIIGDRKGVVFAALDPDVSALMGGDVAIPQNIRTGAGSVVMSPITMTEEAVAAMDNMAPAAVTDVHGDAETGMITWTLSADEGPVGAVNYRGYAIPIPGVHSYVIKGGVSEDALIEIGHVPAGTGAFQVPLELIQGLIDQGAPSAVVVVVAFDGTNAMPSVPLIIELAPTRKMFVDADGGSVYIVKLDEAMTPLMVDFEDFVAFTMAFNHDASHENWRVFIQSDLNDDGIVNFEDFILFFGSYGKEATGPATKSLIPALGVNENAEFSLRLGSDRVVVGETMFVDVSLANVQALMGYGFVLNYDADKFEFVEAVPVAEDLLTSSGGEIPLLKGWSPKAGQVHVMNAIVNGQEVSGNGDIVRLAFRVLRNFEDDARFEVAEGMVFDPQQLANPLAGGVLDIQTTPTEFALLQNFPNPFNPDTTIGYELAESADVTLQIYNVVGQVVRTLMAAEPQSVGRYQVRWDGMDDRGTPVSSGIYFYQISAGKFQDVRKLMLLK